MCKVIEFPRKKELSDELKEKITKLAEDYVDVFYGTLAHFEVDENDSSEIEEVGKEITIFYTEQLQKILETKEEGF